MKQFLTILAMLIVLLTKPQTMPICTYKTVLQDIPPRLFQMTTTDPSNQNTILTRFFHNKVQLFLGESTMCYFNFFDIVSIAQQTAYLGLFGWFYFVYKLLLSRRWLLIAAFFMLPIIPFLLLIPEIIFLHKIFAIIGLGLTFRKFS